MIRTALQFIQSELEAYIVNRENEPGSYKTDNVVDLKPIVLPNGNINITDSTHVTVMLVNIEEERREGKQAYYLPTPDKKYQRLNPPVEIDLFLLFVANNSDYPTALRDLSDVIGFFQSHAVFDSQSYPSLNASVADAVSKPWQLIDRLSFKLVSLTFEQQNNLWGMLSSKYMPSAVYRVKLLTAFETKGNDVVTAVSELDFVEN
jgi:hypothetical protein